MRKQATEMNFSFPRIEKYGWHWIKAEKGDHLVYETKWIEGILHKKIFNPTEEELNNRTELKLKSSFYEIIDNIEKLLEEKYERRTRDETEPIFVDDIEIKVTIEMS